MNLPDPGLNLGSPALHTDSLPTETSGKLSGISQREKDKYCMPLHVKSKKQMNRVIDTKKKQVVVRAGGG